MALNRATRTGVFDADAAPASRRPRSRSRRRAGACGTSSVRRGARRSPACSAADRCAPRARSRRASISRLRAAWPRRARCRARPRRRPSCPVRSRATGRWSPGAPWICRAARRPRSAACRPPRCPTRRPRAPRRASARIPRRSRRTRAARRPGMLGTSMGACPARSRTSAWDGTSVTMSDPLQGGAALAAGAADDAVGAGATEAGGRRTMTR